MKTQLTVQDIHENAREQILGGKILQYGNDKITFSVVGGRSNLYGDFENTFELAILDTKTRAFITSSVLKTEQDVIGWMTLDELISKSNELLSDGFQFFTIPQKIDGGNG